MIAIGVDPGSSSGAIAVNRDGKLSIFKVGSLTEQEMSNTFYQAILQKEMGEQMFAIIEQVNAMPKQGVTSSFKFGQNYGFLRACLVAHEIPFEALHPKKWQKHYSMSKKKNETKTEWKKRLLNVAQNLYPSEKIPLYAADAVLLSHIALKEKL